MLLHVIVEMFLETKACTDRTVVTQASSLIIFTRHENVGSAVHVYETKQCTGIP